LDVDEQDITDQFPPWTHRDPRTGAVQILKPGGLTQEYRKKLQNNRAKLEELRAKPAEKKDDKK
jgi:hypothetical protein